MSHYHSKLRWRRGGVVDPNEMLRRAPGFNRYFFHEQSGVLYDRRGKDDDNENDGSTLSAAEEKLLSIDEEFNKVYSDMFHSRDTYQQAMNYTVTVLKDADSKKCREWACNFLFVIISLHKEHFNECDIEKTLVPDFVNIKDFCDSDCNFNSGSSVLRFVNNFDCTQRGRWDSLLTILWTAYCCPDDNDDVVFATYYKSNTSKAVETNTKSPLFLGYKMFILDLIVSIFDDDTLIAEINRLCPRRGVATSIHRFVNKYEPVLMNTLALAALATPVVLSEISGTNFNISGKVIGRIMEGNRSAASIQIIPADLSQDEKALLPLHLAVMSGKRWDDGVGYLYAANIDAALIREPSHHWLPLHCASFTSKTDPSVVSSLLYFKPESATLKDKCGRLPLHLISSGEKECMGCIDELLAAHPQGMYEADLTGNTPNSHTRTCSNTTEDEQMLTSEDMSSTSLSDVATFASGEVPTSDDIDCVILEQSLPVTSFEDTCGRERVIVAALYKNQPNKLFKMPLVEVELRELFKENAKQ